MKTYTVSVAQTVSVTIDESKFDERFMADFRNGFYPFFEVTDHVEHIAQLQARGVVELEFTSEFIEGYGPSSDMAIKAKVIDLATEVLTGGAA